MKSNTFWKLIMGLILWSVPQFANADEITQGEELFIFQLGYFLPSFDTNLRVDNANISRGDDVNLEKDLGYEHNETTILGSVTWRISERNRLSLGYFAFHRNGHRSLEKEISIGDEVYPIGAELDSSIHLTVIPISYSYSFLKTDTWEVAGTAGLQWSTITFDATGSTSLGGSGSDARVRADALAPLPLIGVDANYYVAPRWTIGGNVGVFTYKIGASNMAFQGTIINATVNTDWWFSNYVGAGAAINWFSFNVNVDSSKWDGKFNYQYLGPQIYLVGRF
jgi:hypothetical protein